MIQRVLLHIIAIESIYSVMLMAICLAIYFKTEELEKLSQHKGINYFRKTFLFFAISYFLKFITRALLFGFSGLQPRGMRDSMILQVMPGISTGIFSVSVYASVIASFYLISSIAWKKENRTYSEAFWHIIAFLIGLLTVFFDMPWIFIASQVCLFFYGIFKVLTRKKKSFFIVYSLLLFFWAISIVEIFIPDFLIQIQLLMYISSIILFSTIFFRVQKSTRG